jgi:hypothetical protein
MSNLKWTRKEPGHYVSGTWHVKGAGTSWDLYDGRKHIASSKSKKECQQIAEDPPKKEEEPTIEDRGTGHKPKGAVKLDDLHGVMTSLYLEMTHITTSVTENAHYNKKLSESIDKLTSAVLILGKHVAKLNTPQGK